VPSGAAWCSSVPDHTRIKICGLTDPAEAAACAALGVWAIGMVFAAESPRRVDSVQARRIVDALPGGVHRVGVFVNPDPDEAAGIVAEVGLTHVQLHGAGCDVAATRAATGLPVIRGVAIAGREDVDAARASDADLVLLDASVAGRHGGTGTQFDWALLGDGGLGRPYLLAGGLTPESVADAIARLDPMGVDVSSGVEAAPGRKDLTRVRAFVDAVRRAAPVGSPA
jgi:phosphoribosylanthranilate isomerase